MRALFHFLVFIIIGIILTVLCVVITTILFAENSHQRAPRSEKRIIIDAECMKQYKNETNCVSKHIDKVYLNYSNQTELVNGCFASQQCIRSNCEISKLFSDLILEICDYKHFYVTTLKTCIDELRKIDNRLDKDISANAEKINEFCSNGSKLSQVYLEHHKKIREAQNQTSTFSDIKYLPNS
ncbi:unnamed protein product [Caenorhabditis angaria]|uniref:DUF19 domain-containing protein n=1 Tax=Caenorhabditis angaria TaxID=860376 RepID=A0A9P1J431_9PELO|nr:unnamed protein product [Caenorhabditis angaria]